MTDEELGHRIRNAVESRLEPSYIDDVVERKGNLAYSTHGTRRRMAPRYVSAIVLATVLAAALIVVARERGSSDDELTVSAPSEEAREILLGALQATTVQASYRFRFELQILETPDSCGVYSPAVQPPLADSVKGAVDERARVGWLEVTGDDDIDAFIDGDAVYVSSRLYPNAGLSGRWLRSERSSPEMAAVAALAPVYLLLSLEQMAEAPLVPGSATTPELQVAEVDAFDTPRTVLRKLERSATEATALGREDVGGVGTTRYSVVADGVAYLNWDQSALMTPDGEQVFPWLDMGRPAPIAAEVWIDDDQLVRRIVVETRFLIAEAPRFTTTIDYLAFGESTEVPAVVSEQAVAPGDLPAVAFFGPPAELTQPSSGCSQTNLVLPPELIQCERDRLARITVREYLEGGPTADSDCYQVATSTD